MGIGGGGREKKRRAEKNEGEKEKLTDGEAGKKMSERS